MRTKNVSAAMRSIARKKGPKRNSTFVLPMRIRTSASDGVVKVRAGFDAGVITQSAGAFVGVGIGVILNNFNEVASYAGAFDQYRIDWISLSILSLGNPNDTTIIANLNTSCYGIVVIDYDDDAAPATVAGMMSYASSKVFSCFSPKTQIACKPEVGVGIGNSGAATNAAGLARGIWINTNTTNIKHYGFKIGLPQITGAATGGAACFRLLINAGISFKNAR